MNVSSIKDVEGFCGASDRRTKMRRAGDGCVMTQEQLNTLLKKVDLNHEANIRNENVEKRLTAVELSVKELCSRMSSAMKFVIATLVSATTALIIGIWQMMVWLQELISHAVIVS